MVGPMHTSPLLLLFLATSETTTKRAGWQTLPADSRRVYDSSKLCRLLWLFSIATDQASLVRVKFR